MRSLRVMGCAISAMLPKLQVATCQIIRCHLQVLEMVLEMCRLEAVFTVPGKRGSLAGSRRVVP